MVKDHVCLVGRTCVTLVSTLGKTKLRLTPWHPKTVSIPRHAVDDILLKLN